MTHQILLRLNEYFKYEINFFIEDEINILEYYNIIENHFKLNLLKKEKNLDLEKFTGLYTITQKSLLNKYKVLL